MKKLLAMALALVMICSLFAVPTMAADSINIIETNDYGSVTAEVGGTTIEVVADHGYYLYSAELNGSDITDSFVAGYKNYNTDTAWGYNEKWTYTLAEGTLTAADELKIAYGYYTTNDVHVKNGDAEACELDAAGSDFKPANSSSTITRTTADNNGGSYSFLLTSGRLRGTLRTFTAGEKYLIKFDAKASVAAESSTVQVYGQGPFNVQQEIMYQPTILQHQLQHGKQLQYIWI